ncbi:hypothetical protein TNCV_3412111, partial [Trichonephila clavipes]
PARAWMRLWVFRAIHDKVSFQSEPNEDDDENNHALQYRPCSIPQH